MRIISDPLEISPALVNGDKSSGTKCVALKNKVKHDLNSALVHFSSFSEFVGPVFSLPTQSLFFNKQ